MPTCDTRNGRNAVPVLMFLRSVFGREEFCHKSGVLQAWEAFFAFISGKLHVQIG